MRDINIETKMLRIKKMKLVSLCILSIFIFMVILSSGIVAGQQGIIGNVDEKLAELSDEEKIVLKKLFELAQVIEDMELEEDKVAAEIEKSELEILELEKFVKADETELAKNKEALKQVLKSYQRMGPSSYLQKLLDSSSLVVFLRKLNILQNLTRNTGELLKLIQESRDNLTVQKDKLDKKIASMDESQERLTEAISKTNELKVENEKYLTSLAEERTYYQNQLANIQLAWNELTLFFPGLSKEFSHIIKEAQLPADALMMTIMTSGISVSVSDETINNFLANYGLPELALKFYPDKIEIVVPEKKLVLAGTFILKEKTLIFQPHEGTFYGMPLKPENLEELFKEEELLLDLNEIVGRNAVRSVNIMSGLLELMISPVFQ